MASLELRKRANWQTISGALALDTEDLFAISLQSALDGAYPNTFSVDRHPSEFNDIYSKHKLDDQTLSSIYNIDVEKKNAKGNFTYKWGISLDFAIRNLKNEKILFGEIKRQDGWVENTLPSAGRGNAHERSNKYFTPGLMKALREKANYRKIYCHSG